MHVHPLWNDQYWPLIIKLYEGNARRLSRDVKQLRQMAGFGTGGLFFDDVCIDNDFERDYCPVADDTAMTPAMLTLILNLYFQLIPDTMKATTPEVQLLAKRLHVTPDEVVQVLKLCLAEDPCIPEHRRERLLGSSSAADPLPSLSQAVNKLWHRYGNGDAIMVEEAAERFDHYFE